MSKALEVSEEQGLWFRARRLHLAGPGASDAGEAARDILGAQTQLEAAGLHALSLRSADRPTAAALRARLYEPGRDLVRVWGQRDTLHIYDAASDWAQVIAAIRLWSQSGRRGTMPEDEVLGEILRVFEEAGRPLTRSELFGAIPTSYIEEVSKHPNAGDDPQRFAATRLVWRLTKLGHLSQGPMQGAQNLYVARSTWFGDVAWPALLDEDEVCVALTRRYLRVCAPATAQDIAHHFGARVSDAKRWLEVLRPELVEVSCAGRKGLVALALDADALREPAPAEGSEAWPLRLLPLYDTMLMMHADKRWTVPDPAEEKQVWRKAAYVAATVVERGRLAATWVHEVERPKKGPARVRLTLEPMRRYRPEMLPSIEREAEALARHLGCEGAEVGVSAWA